jgi:hypothetical protein
MQEAGPLSLAVMMVLIGSAFPQQQTPSKEEKRNL